MELLCILALTTVFAVVVALSQIRLMKSQSSSTLVGFQHAVHQRSTMDIIYSCISTTIICTISATHLNIPKRDADRLGFWEKIRSKTFWTEVGRKLGYWAVGLLMPEFVVLFSCREYYDALEDYTIMQKLCPEWTLQHSFFALMKGFTIEDGNRIRSGLELYERGAILDEGACDKYYLEINDRTKANILTKVIAITQITRFLLEEIDRACNGLPISPLEYVTCAQVLVALFTYVYWFDKPFGVLGKIRVQKGSKRRVIYTQHGSISTITVFASHHIHKLIFFRGPKVFNGDICGTSHCSKRLVILEHTISE